MIVPTELGKVHGFLKTSVGSGRKFFSFLGIPYAKPPVGELRFLPPEPAEPWNDVYDANHERNMCCQSESLHPDDISGSEDCLYLNVHTAAPNDTAIMKPVMVYIHGGGFLQGSGHDDTHGGDYLIDNSIVLVTINYRLHILGFLNLGIAECPGNVGLKDQVMALKWVKKNIRQFGGNPENITIFGCSAGACSVHLLMMSPLAKGLFQKAIMQSGNALISWSITNEPIKWAFEVGRKLGHEGDDPKELVKYLKTVPAEDIVKTMLRILDDILEEFPGRSFYFPFSPSVETIEEDAFLPDCPEKMIQSMEPIPCMLGSNDLEGSLMWRVLPANIREDPLAIFPHIITSNFKVKETDIPRIEAKLKSFYFEHGNPRDTEWQKLMNLISDIVFYRFYKSYEALTKSKIPPFVYHFIYYDEMDMSEFKDLKTSPNLRKLARGAFHGSEVNFLLSQKVSGVPVSLTGASLKVQNNICSLWANFAKSGNPTAETFIEWKQCTDRQPCYLQIDVDLKMMNGKINEKRMEFIKSVFNNAELLK
ncbi:esterase FE4-like [Planococcus citri]|uniref:esterase FE4-like n=1 Tax=Planococcus citri TaxID=170843 RepID=UPI0031F76A3B